jgi:hypothetical protein
VHCNPDGTDVTVYDKMGDPPLCVAPTVGQVIVAVEVFAVNDTLTGASGILAGIAGVADIHDGDAVWLVGSLVKEFWTVTLIT